MSFHLDLSSCFALADAMILFQKTHLVKCKKICSLLDAHVWHFLN